MPQAIFALPYFGSISYYSELVKYDNIVIEESENYQKQSYRNRQYIYGANGKLMLNIPVKHGKSKHRIKYKDSKVENDFKWQNLHFKSLEAAYRTSPYFEFYEEDFEPLFNKKYTHLFTFNFDCFKTVLASLNLELKIEFNSTYETEYDGMDDRRYLINAKKFSSKSNKPYHQVFEDKFGFIENLSILDLLFNLGPESVPYLKSINVSQS
jgi:hypothetical protein